MSLESSNWENNNKPDKNLSESLLNAEFLQKAQESWKCRELQRALEKAKEEWRSEELEPALKKYRDDMKNLNMVDTSVSMDTTLIQDQVLYGAFLSFMSLSINLYLNTLYF